MKNSLWVVFVVVSGFLGFLIGYSVSSYTGFHKVQQGSVAVAEAGGYGGESGGYGAESAGDQAAIAGSKEEGEDYGERTGYFGGK